MPAAPPYRLTPLIAILLTLMSLPLTAAVPADNRDVLQDGFNDMYNLSFADAHGVFERWEKTNPDDPRGPVFDAAAYLFSEFDRLRILQSQFFLDDRSFTANKGLTPDPQVKREFDRALSRGRAIADTRLRQSPHDEFALFATVLSYGLQSDYDALIDKENLRALSEIKEGRRIAEELLSLYPKCYDAYIAVGVENYLLSLKPAPIRWLLHATGAQTDKETGIANLKLTAAKGRYLQPYAELLLAVAALRDKNDGEASRLLAGLATRFPGNQLYRAELQKLN